MLLIVLPWYSKVSWGTCSLISRLHVLSLLIKNFHETLHKIILYYHVTKQFLPCWNWFVKRFQFQNMFWKNINWFRFWWKTYTKRCKSNFVISLVRRLFSPAVFGWSVSGYDLENGTWRLKSRFWYCSAFVYFSDLKNTCVLPLL